MACEIGTYGTNCETSASDLEYWIVYRVVVSITCSLLFAASIYGRLRAIRKPISPIYGRTMNTVFGLSLLLCIATFAIAAIDPFGLDGVVPKVIAMMLISTLLPLISTVQEVHLVNIISIHNKATDRFKKIEMLERMNSTYKREVCMHEVLVWDSKMVTIGAVIAMLEWIGSLASGAIVGLGVTNAYIYWDIWWLIIWIWCLIRNLAFFYYIRKITALLPSSCEEMLRDYRYMWRVGIQQIVTICVWIILTVIIQFVQEPNTFITMLLLFSFVVIVSVILNLLIYIDFGANDIRVVIHRSMSVSAQVNIAVDA